MDPLVERAKPVIHKLFQSDEPQLYEELGLRLKAIAADESLSGFFEPQIGYNAEFMGPLDDLRAFGQKFFDKTSREAYSLMCGGGLSKEEREKMSAAFGSKTDLAAFVAALLVSHFAMAPAIAAVVGALVLRLFFRPAHEAMCEVWSQHIRQANN